MLHRAGPVLLAALLLLIAVSAGAQTSPPAGSAPAAAAADSPYTVGGVEVDVTSASAAEARDKAILEGQQAAFVTLFKRLAADGTTKVPPTVGASDLQRMIQGFEIERERGSAVRYVGTLSFTFRRKAVRSYLAGLGVRVVEPAARTAVSATGPGTAPGTEATPAQGLKPTLVLPVSHGKGANLLWEERTPWRSAWEDFSVAAGAAKVVVPPGELSDIADIGAKEAVAGDAAALAKIAAHYSVGDVVVAQLSEWTLDPAAGAQVAIARYAADGRPDGAPVTLPVAGVPGETPAAFLGRVVGAVVERLASLPRAPVKPPVVEARLEAGVAISGMQDWLEIRRRLSSNPMVLGIETRSMARSRVDVSVRYRGEPEGLRAMLDRDGLTLVQAPGGWSLSLKSMVSTAAPPTVMAPVGAPRPLAPSSVVSSVPVPPPSTRPGPAYMVPAAPPQAYAPAPSASEYDPRPDDTVPADEPPEPGDTSVRP
ncbi:MAG: DUF2066 domain-containing protein [Rhodospirillaceae bacterium]